MAAPLIVSPRGPLIKVAKQVKWRRDPGITEVIEWLDEPERRDKWDALTPSEFKEVQKISKRCREDFSYAARNFFWISTKDRVDKLFSLWESQELILEHLLRMKSRGIAQKVIIIKARQLGCSTLIEGLIAWRSMFFRNVNALVVSYDREHSAYLFGIMQHIYDMMPWWLKPQYSSREYKDGLVFDKKDSDSRRDDPGLQSRVKVDAANKMSGVGQGIRVSCAHVSEFSDFDQNTAKDIIEADLGRSLPRGPETFAVLESTAKGAGTYAHRLWLKNVELAERASWSPLFLPWFFDSTSVRPLEPGWRPDEDDNDMKLRIANDWVRCDNPDCLQYHERWLKGEDRSETACATCGGGTLHVYMLTDKQLCFMQNERINAKKDDESLRALHQELASTAEDAFQLSGFKLFGDSVQTFVNSCVREPAAEGFIDSLGIFHCCYGKRPKARERDGREWHLCIQEGCKQDHSWGDDSGEKPLKIWEFPEPNAVYVIGADVAEGLGSDADYDAAVVIRVSQSMGADRVVAVFRSNTTDTITYAKQLNFLGRWYNEAMLSIELNKYDTTASYVRFQLTYPNLYRWKNLDSINIQSSKLGWVTQSNSKPRLWQTMNHFLKDKLLVCPSRNFAEELKTFQKEEYDDRSGGAGRGFFDDEAMAAMIGLYTAHETDWDDRTNQILTRKEVTMDTSEWHMKCTACSANWPAMSPIEEKRCPRCGSIMITGTRNPDKNFMPSRLDYGGLVISEEDGKSDYQGRMNSLAEMALANTNPDAERQEPEYDLI